MSSQNSNMGTENISKLMFRLALPSIAAQLINVLYNIVDRMYVGRIPDVGADALTGLGVSSPILLIVSAFSMFISGGAAPLASIALGKGDKEESDKILGTSVFLLTIISFILPIIIFLNLEALLYMFGASDVTYSYANQYTSIYLLGTIFVQYALGLNLFISSQGQAKVAMFSVVIGAITNIILDPIFIFAFDMGVAGAAIATVISQALSATFVVRFLVSDKSIFRIRKECLKIDWKIAKKSLALGITPFSMQITESAIMIVFNNSLLQYGGDIYVGTMTILQSLIQLLVVPVSGFTHGIQPIISYNYGARNRERVLKTVKYTAIIALATTFSYYILVSSVPSIFASIFTTDTQLIDLVSKVLPIFMAGISLFGMQMTAQTFFLGTGQAGKPLFIALLRKVIILIPLALILPKFFGVMGVFYSEPIADTISATTSGILLYMSVKKLRDDE
ncbi:MAG: MATE family efflux transporter [Clostridiales bacterium]|nr:MATE family efflux transporter [Clostridiales bacterium]